MSGRILARVMYRLAIATGAICVFTAAAHAFSKEAVDDAQALLEIMQRRMETGSATPTDVAEAKHYLLEMKYKAGQIQLTEYCRMARPSLEAVVKGLDDRRTTREVIEVKRTWFQFKATCGRG